MEADLPLRDIHLPEVVGIWPPAIGWWTLALLILLICVLLIQVYRWFGRKTAAREALKVLSRIRQDHSAPPLERLQSLSVLLRRVALSHSSRAETAGLTGLAWLSFLDQSLPGEPFVKGKGQVFADAHFQPLLADDVDIDALTGLCEQWIKTHK